MMTGIHGSLREADYQTIMYLNKADPTNPKYPIPEYFWKAITLSFSHNGKEYRNGIILVMHNTVNPNNEPVEQKICPEDGDVAAENGWEFLPDGQQFKGSMYACKYNEINMDFFQEEMTKNLPANEAFNLRDLTLLHVDPQGNESTRQVNVLDEIRKVEKDENEDSSIGESEDEQVESEVEKKSDEDQQAGSEEVQPAKRRRL